jgi:hypothetical protein
MKFGEVFTLLLTGKNLDNWNTYNKVSKLVLKYSGAIYPVIEVAKNESDFILIINKR